MTEIIPEGLLGKVAPELILRLKGSTYKRLNKHTPRANHHRQYWVDYGVSMGWDLGPQGSPGAGQGLGKAVGQDPVAALGTRVLNRGVSRRKTGISSHGALCTHLGEAQTPSFGHRGLGEEAPGGEAWSVKGDTCPPGVTAQPSM